MNNDLTPSFGRLLAQFMHDTAFNSNKLASKIGVASISVNRWINEEVNNPRCENVAEIIKALGLTDEQGDQLLLSAGCRPRKSTIRIHPQLINELPDKPNKLPLPGIPISHPAQFFGRTDILKRIRRAWQQPSALQHIAVIGDRRSGKTSLLKYLQYISKIPATDLREEQPQGWHDWLPTDFQFAFVDFQLASMSQPKTLLTNILTQLNFPIPEPCDLINFSMVLDDHVEKPTVILMDEMGSGLQAPELDAIFWSNMRALGNNCADGQLGLVVTAHEPIHQLAKDNCKESPFFNIFGHTVNLKPLKETEAETLLNYFSNALSPEDIHWMIQKSGCWPALLQILCDERIHALEDGETSDYWKTEALNRIEPFLYLLHPV
jgi:hypothetical protein